VLSVTIAYVHANFTSYQSGIQHKKGYWSELYKLDMQTSRQNVQEDKSPYITNSSIYICAVKKALKISVLMCWKNGKQTIIDFRNGTIISIYLSTQRGHQTRETLPWEFPSNHLKHFFCLFISNLRESIFHEQKPNLSFNRFSLEFPLRQPLFVDCIQQGLHKCLASSAPMQIPVINSFDNPPPSLVSY
jgi:hypothetical protein